MLALNPAPVYPPGRGIMYRCKANIQIISYIIVKKTGINICIEDRNKIPGCDANIRKIPVSFIIIYHS